MMITYLLLGCITATSLMTAFSYALSKISGQQFREPELLNGLLNRLMEKSFPPKHPAGWCIHYGVGLLFVVAYYAFFRTVDSAEPNATTFSVLGFISGVIGAGVWFITRSLHPSPPATNQWAFYTQLVPAHVLFGLGAWINHLAIGLP